MKKPCEGCEVRHCNKYGFDKEERKPLVFTFDFNTAHEVNKNCQTDLDLLAKDIASNIDKEIIDNIIKNGED